MRWLLVFMLLLNLVAFTWFSVKQQTGEHNRAPVAQQLITIPPGTPSLVLLSERRPNASEPGVLAPAVAPGSTAGESAEAEIEVAEAASSPELPEPEQQVRNPAADSSQDASDSTAVVEQDQPALADTEPQAPADPGTTEPSPVAGEEESESDQAVAASAGMPAAVPVDRPSQCLMLGPFSEAVSARQLLGRLEGLDISADLKQQSLAADPIYWVYLAPLQSRKAALAMLKTLQSKRIDSFLITSGDLKYGISLGYFRSEEAAYQVEAARQKQGFDARVMRKERTREVIWAVLDEQNAAKVSQALVAKLTDDFEFLQKRQIVCEHVASLADLE